MSIPKPMIALFALALTACGGGNAGPAGDVELCGTATGSAFRLIVYEVEVPDRKPDGRAWDLDGSHPDIYVCIGTDNSSWEYGCTDTVVDRTSATFSDYTEGVARGDVYVDVWDEDLTDDDEIGGFYMTPDTLRSLADCGREEVTGRQDYGVDRIVFEVVSI